MAGHMKSPRGPRAARGLDSTAIDVLIQLSCEYVVLA